MSHSCLVLIAHGSKNANWLKPFQQLARELKQDVGEDNVCLCYMEHSTPQLRDVVQELSARGTHSVRILPLFMAKGNHLEQDIPVEIEEIQRGFPKLKITLLPPIGEHPLFLGLMRELARQYITEQEMELQLISGGSLTTGAPLA